MSERPPVSRIVHLQGGLRAVDVGSDKVFVQAHGTKRFLHFPAPAYASLYASLKSLGFHVVGVEFVTGRQYDAPDWWFAPPEGRFKLTASIRAWGEMQHLASKQQKPEIADISRRCAALLELLGLRLLQMSSAYNGAYLAHARKGRLAEEHLFDNTYIPHIEAAIHAFLSDATNLRDVLFEFVWTFLLQEPGDWSFKKMRAHPKISDHGIAVSMVEAGEDGWLKRLSELRNDVVHVAPIGAHHIFPPCHVRRLTLPDAGSVLYINYGLVDRAAVQSITIDPIATRDEESFKAELRAYKAQLEASDDALEYAWKTLGQLIEVCESARVASGIKGEMPRIGPEDIVDFKMA